MNYAIETTYVPNLGKGLYPEDYKEIPNSSNSPEKPDSSDEHYPTIKTLNFPVTKPYAIVYSGDYHVPYHDESVLEPLNKFLAWLKPDCHIRNGDIHDFYGLSKFVKNPKLKCNLQSELDLCYRVLKKQKDASPDTLNIFIEGNHEARLQRYLWDNADALSDLRCLELPRLLGLTDLGFKVASYEDGLMINDIFLARHGELIRKYSGWTAKAHAEKHGGNGIVGHSHRGGEYFKRTRFGLTGWAENFCLCSLDPEYCSFPDWQQGFTVQTFFTEHQYHLEQIKIINKQIMYQGKVF